MRIWAWKEVVTAKLNVLFQNASKTTEKYQRYKDTTQSNVASKWKAGSQVPESRCSGTVLQNFYRVVRNPCIYIDRQFVFLQAPFLYIDYTL